MYIQMQCFLLCCSVLQCVGVFQCWGSCFLVCVCVCERERERERYMAPPSTTVVPRQVYYMNSFLADVCMSVSTGVCMCIRINALLCIFECNYAHVVCVYVWWHANLCVFMRLWIHSQASLYAPHLWTWKHTHTSCDKYVHTCPDSTHRCICEYTHMHTYRHARTHICWHIYSCICS